MPPPPGGLTVDGPQLLPALRRLELPDLVAPRFETLALFPCEHVEAGTRRGAQNQVVELVRFSGVLAHLRVKVEAEAETFEGQISAPCEDDMLSRILPGVRREAEVFCPGQEAMVPETPDLGET